MKIQFRNTKQFPCKGKPELNPQAVKLWNKVKGGTFEAKRRRQIKEYGGKCKSVYVTSDPQLIKLAEKYKIGQSLQYRFCACVVLREIRG